MSCNSVQDTYYMQVTKSVTEREARYRLPGLLADLLGEPASAIELSERDDFPRADLVATDARGRMWMIEVKSSGGPGQVAAVAEQQGTYRRQGVVPLLAVPYMSRAGTEAADRARVNWIDLSGNAHIRSDDLHIWVQGRPDELRSRGRPSSPFAPRSSRVTRVLLLDPGRWWLQKDLAIRTGLDDGNVSRIARRLEEELLVERRGRELRPRDPGSLLDAWAQDYRFSGHDIWPGHFSGSGIDLARTLSSRLDALGIRYAFTGLPAAWAMDQFASFRLTTVYVHGDPRDAAQRLGVRTADRGANIQLVGPNDSGVFAGEGVYGGIRCVAPVQVYVDLLHLPERAPEAALHLRAHSLGWQDDAAR